MSDIVVFVWKLFKSGIDDTKIVRVQWVQMTYVTLSPFDTFDIYVL